MAFLQYNNGYIMSIVISPLLNVSNRIIQSNWNLISSQYNGKKELFISVINNGKNEKKTLDKTFKLQR